MCDAVLGLNLAKLMANVLKVDMREVTFTTDSMRVLYWIYNRSRLFRSFVLEKFIHALNLFNGDMSQPNSNLQIMTVNEKANSNTWGSGLGFLEITEDE